MKKHKLPTLDKDHMWVRIPVPRSTQNVNRGFFVSDAEPTVPRSIRFTAEDFERITKTAFDCNMSFSEFVRWCSVFAAVEIANERHRRGFIDAQPVAPPPSKDGWHE